MDNICIFLNFEYFLFSSVTLKLSELHYFFFLTLVLESLDYPKQLTSQLRSQEWSRLSKQYIKRLEGGVDAREFSTRDNERGLIAISSLKH